MKKQEYIHLFSLLNKVDDCLLERLPRYSRAVADVSADPSDTKDDYHTAVMDGYRAIADAVTASGNWETAYDTVGDVFARWDELFAPTAGTATERDMTDRTVDSRRDPESYTGVRADGGEHYPAELPDSDHAREIYYYLENRLGQEAVAEQWDDVREFIELVVEGYSEEPDHQFLLPGEGDSSAVDGLST